MVCCWLFWRSLSYCLSYMNSVVLIIRGAWALTVAEDGCVFLWRSSNPYFEHCFLTPAGLSSFYHWSSQCRSLIQTFMRHCCGLQASSWTCQDIAMGSRSSAELTQDIALGFRILARFFGSLVHYCILLYLTLWVSIIK